MQIKGPAQQLAEYMIKLSQKHYDQEWAFGLEYELWNEVIGNQDLLSDEEIRHLDDASEWCKGWITMAYDGGEEKLEFIHQADWEEKYQKNKPF